LLAGVALAALCFAAHPAFAEEAAAAPHTDVNPLELSPEQLFSATVTVTSVSGLPETAWDAPAAITVLSNEDIHRSGATSIPEALRMVPGVQVARTGAGSWAVGIRGLNGPLNNKLLVLIDGREIYDHLFSGVYWDIQDLPLEDIDRIEVIRGPGSTLWGANAVNGVINIITKDASATQGTLVSALAGNQDRFTGVGRYGGKFGDNGYYRVYGKYFDRADETSAITGGSAEDGLSMWHSGFRTDWNKSADKVTVQGDLYRGDSGNLRNVPNTVAPPFFTREFDEVNPNGANLLARWTRTLSSDSSFQLQTYVDYTHRDDELVLDDRRTSLDTQAQYDFPTAGRHKVIAGARFRYSYDTTSTNTATGIATQSEPSHTDQLYSAFVQDKITLQPQKLELTVGSKVEHNVFTGVEIEPSARLQWTPDDTHVLWTSVSRAVRTPSQLEEEMKLVAGVVPFLGVPLAIVLEPSPAFQSEELIAYEAGYRQKLTPDMTLDVATFFNDYSKLETLKLGAFDFSTFPPAITLPIFFTNGTSGQTYGVETTVNWQARRNWKLVANSTFLLTTLHGPPSTTAIASEAGEKQSPENQFNLISQWDVTDKVAFDTMAYHVAPLSGFKVSDYWRLDARAGYKVRDGVEAELVGQNLLHDKHREFTALTDPTAVYVDRSVFARLTCRF
jgi:iron complex outermembrane receptor protein